MMKCLRAMSAIASELTPVATFVSAAAGAAITVCKACQAIRQMKQEKTYSCANA